MKFTIEIEHGKDTIEAGFDLASELVKLGRSMPSWPVKRSTPLTDTTIKDNRGNVIGKWEVTA